MASKRSLLGENDTTVSKCKRNKHTDSEEELLPKDSFRNMIHQFGADVNKAFIAKRKQFNNFTSSTLKNSSQKMSKMWQNQQKDRSRITEDYNSQFNAVFQQWKVDLNKTKDMDEKLESMFHQQQKMFQHMKAAQGQRLKTLKQLLEQYTKGLKEMDKTHVEEQGELLNDLRQEMGVLQKNMLMANQKQEIASVRKSLQTMLM
ncbi:synaptonemal complex protein 3-like [Engraulis encrasicolus]|uniref:synaptonemal complex protein 3-like n=1 Tax=Engraulis encrasicolus TaxID=184585 RepID=UPI002FD34499